jgi:hypothetical protein
MTWSGTGSCALNSAYCSEGAAWTPSKAITITQFTITMLVVPAGCTVPGAVVIGQNAFSSILSTITMVNGTASYTNSGLSIAVNPASGPIQVAVNSTAASGCSTYGNGVYWTIEYKMQ